MSDLLNIIKNYSIKYDRKIKNICSPLVTHLNIPVFTYCFVEANGNFGYITNAIEFNEYYFSQQFYLANPYFSHPALFRSGSVLSPCTFDHETQTVLRNTFQADHLFLMLQANESKTECFIFANENKDVRDSMSYLTQIDLLTKFGRYFKRETKDLLGSMRADQFNIQKARGVDLFEMPPSVPLANNDPQILSFLKKVSGLTHQEQRCLELFKQGHSAQATGALMGISRRTVESYFESIKNKLGCTSKYDLLDY